MDPRESGSIRGWGGVIGATNDCLALMIQLVNPVIKKILISAKESTTFEEEVSEQTLQ